MKDLLGDRGASLGADVHQHGPTGQAGWDDMAVKLTEGLGASTGEKDEDRDPEEEEEEDRDPEEEEKDDQDSGDEESEAKDGPLVIDGVGEVTPEEIADAFDVAIRAQGVFEELEQAQAQIADMRTRESQVAGAMELQALLDIPEVDSAVRQAINRVMQENPQVFRNQGRRGPDPEIAQLREEMRKIQQGHYQQEVQGHVKSIDDFYSGLEAEYGENWPQGFTERIHRTALQRYGKNITREALEDVAKRLILDRGLAKAPKKDAGQRVAEAVGKANNRVRVLKGGSRKDAQPKPVDSRRMSNREFDNFFIKNL